MNKEIKEILDKLKEEIDLKPLWYSERIKLLDYITNLQQIEQEHQRINGELREENERLKIRLELSDSMLQTETEHRELLQSRCEKVSDKMQYIIDYGFDYDGFNTVESLKGLIDMLVDYARESKNILQNGSENNEC